MAGRPAADRSHRADVAVLAPTAGSPGWCAMSPPATTSGWSIEAHCARGPLGEIRSRRSWIRPRRRRAAPRDVQSRPIRARALPLDGGSATPVRRRPARRHRGDAPPAHVNQLCTPRPGHGGMHADTARPALTRSAARPRRTRPRLHTRPGKRYLHTYAQRILIRSAECGVSRPLDSLRQ
jgi:hypothetical protein